MEQPQPLPAELLGIQKAAGGYVFGPWLPKIDGNPALATAQKYPPLLPQLPSPVRESLESEWNGLETEGNGLRSQARQLEPRDQALARDGAWLVEEDKWLKGENSAIEAARSRYRSRCWVNNPPSDCESERARLNSRIDAYNARVGVFNSRLGDWKSRYEDIGGSGDALDAAIAAWGARLNQFSARAQKALEESAVTRVRIQAQTGTTVLASASLGKQGKVTLQEGFQLLGQVYEQLSQSERNNRVNAFPAAQEFMQKCAGLGGCTGPVEQPLYNNPVERPWGPRIDITVFIGTAFVDNPAMR